MSENLTGYSLSELEAFAVRIGEKPFRGRQLFSWIYQKRAISFAQMSELSKALREKLLACAQLGWLQLAEKRSSAHSDAVKYLFRLHDGAFIESVYIAESNRHTLCLSTQVGCALGCAFCVTGQLGFKRNLTAGEIVDQVLFIERDLNVKMTNIVLMGMGEPMMNYEAAMKACELIHHDSGIAIGHRHIVVSTVGIVPAIYRYTDEEQPFRLAISLHAADDEKRQRLVPIGRKYRLAELIKAASYYAKKLRRRPTFEYVLLAGVNDSEDDARALRKLLSVLPCKVNLIPYNPALPEFNRPSDEAIARFAEWLSPMRAPVSVRWSKGVDIQAACGQLAGTRST